MEMQRLICHSSCPLCITCASLANALRAVLLHGLKRPGLLGDLSDCHPWHFIEEAAAKEVERDFASVYSRLVLCKTFRLDDEGKVLGAEEVLYRVRMLPLASLLHS
ncbi:unnamed protein product [Protopolystoma xenopodis]|uniref:RUN domain-containing protein n=1 Tax=Protopolystoma xenopodis TaxID=117903 RepID=A0A448WIM1_9PLAT|nr:unnamed protein product [Protopolystoma xenopodis]